MNAITWPAGYRKSGISTYFSIPFWNQSSRLRKSAKAELLSRNPVEWMDSWQGMSIDWQDTVAFLREVRRLSYANWPNEYFVPDDIASLILGYFADSEMDNEDVLYPVLELYGIYKDSDASVQIEDAVFGIDCTLGMLWRMIYDNRNRGLTGQKGSENSV